jgi:predicted nucleic acid-binding Zn ribbon protein
VRRAAPRELATVLEPVVAAASPQTLLARVQAVWPEMAGRALAGAVAPVAERAGVVTLACESATLAHELELLAPDLVARMNERVGAAGEAPVSRLRCVVGSVPKRRLKDSRERR